MSLSPNWHDVLQKLERLGTNVVVTTHGGHEYDGVITNYVNTGKHGLVQLEFTVDVVHGEQDTGTHLIAQRDIVGITETSDTRNE